MLNRLFELNALKDDLEHQIEAEKEKVSYKIKETMKEKNLTIKDVANQTGLSYSSVYKLINNDWRISLDKLSTALELLNKVENTCGKKCKYCLYFNNMESICKLEGNTIIDEDNKACEKYI
jgi:transcriptional regulator with XRE-family HTH domain